MNVENKSHDDGANMSKSQDLFLTLKTFPVFPLFPVQNQQS